MYSETKNDFDTVGDKDELIRIKGYGETIFDQIKHLFKNVPLQQSHTGWQFAVKVHLVAFTEAVTVTEALVLRPLLEDQGRITESIRLLVTVDRMKQKCFHIMMKGGTINNLLTYLPCYGRTPSVNSTTTFLCSCVKVVNLVKFPQTVSKISC